MLNHSYEILLILANKTLWYFVLTFKMIYFAEI